MAKEDSGRLLSAEQFEANLLQIQQAFTVALDQFQLEFQAGGDLTFEETGPSPIGGIILVGSYGRETPGEYSDIDLQVLIDGEEAGRRGQMTLAYRFAGVMQVALPSLVIDDIVGDTDFTDPKDIRISLEQAQKVVIV